MSNPYQPPQFAGQPTTPFAAGVDRDKLRRVARYQQFVLYALLANILVNVVVLAARGLGFEGVASLLAVFLGLPVVVFAMASIFLLANEMFNAVIGVLCVLLMIVPCIMLLALLFVNGKATAYLQRHGVKVGFMGANPNTI
jgi:hypothetical protein